MLSGSTCSIYSHVLIECINNIFYRITHNINQYFTSTTTFTHTASSIYHLYNINLHFYTNDIYNTNFQLNNISNYVKLCFYNNTTTIFSYKAITFISKTSISHSTASTFKYSQLHHTSSSTTYAYIIVTSTFTTLIYMTSISYEVLISISTRTLQFCSINICVINFYIYINRHFDKISKSTTSISNVGHPLPHLYLDFYNIQP